MQNGAKLSQLSLSSAKLEVWTTLVLHNGSEIILEGEEKTCEPLLSVWKHSSSLSSEVRKRPNLRASDIKGIVLEAQYKDDTFQGDSKVYTNTNARQGGPQNCFFLIKSNNFFEYKPPCKVSEL